MKKKATHELSKRISEILKFWGEIAAALKVIFPETSHGKNTSLQ